MGRERLAKILDKVYMHGFRQSRKIWDLPKDEITISDALDEIDKILTEEQNKKVYCPYCGFQIFATCYCSKPEPGGNMSCMKCLKPLPYIFIPKAKEPPKNKIEPLSFERFYEGKNYELLCLGALKEKLNEICGWINK